MDMAGIVNATLSDIPPQAIGEVAARASANGISGELVMDCIGVLGFLLSLSLAIHGAWEKRTRIGISDAKIFAIENDKTKTINIVLTCTITNQSSAAVSITGGEMALGDFRAPLDVDQTIILGFQSEGNRAFDVCLSTTQLPIFLPPKASCRCKLQSHCQQQHASQLLPLKAEPVADLLGQYTLQAPNRPAHGYSGEKLPVTLHLSTSRSQCKKEFLAEREPVARALQLARNEALIKIS